MKNSIEYPPNVIPFATLTPFVRTTFLVATALIMVSCSSPKSAKLSSSGTVPSGEGAVFGVVCIRHGVVGEVETASGTKESGRLIWGMISGTPKTVRITLIDAVKLMQVGDFEIKGTNTLFCWNLPPGRYAISDVTVEETERDPLDALVGARGRMISKASYRVYGEFEVASVLAPIYVGDLDLGLDDYYRVVGAALRDDFATSSGRFQNAYPKVSGTPVKSLLQLEQKR
jgi:hypothetical protein